MSTNEDMNFEEAKRLAKNHAQEMIDQDLFCNTSEETGDDKDNVYTTANLFAQWSDGSFEVEDLENYLFEEFPEYQ